MSESRAGKMATAAAILMAAFVGSRLLGMVRIMVIGYLFGTSPVLSAYLAAFRLPDLIFQILASGAFASAFIPVFTTYMAKGQEEDAWRITISALNLIGLVSLGLAILTALAAPWLIPLLVPGYSSEAQVLAMHLTRIMLITPVFFGLSSIVTAVLNARHHFTLPALAPLVYNLSIIAGAVLLTSYRGIFALAIGVAVGSMLHLFVQVPGLFRHGVRYDLRIDLRHPGVREVARLLLPRSLGLGASQITFLAYAFLSSLINPESYAALDFAWTLTMLPLGVFAISISTAVFPTLADQAAAGDLESLRRTLASTLRLILFLTVPAGVGLILLREPLIGLLLQRGSFDLESTQMTAHALLFFAVGLFAMGTVEIVTRGFYALHDTRTPVMLALGAMVLNIGFGVVLTRYLAHGGLALGMSLAATAEAAGLVLLLRRKLGGLDEAGIASSVLRVLISTAAMSGIVLLSQAVVPGSLPDFWERVLLVGLGAGLGLAVYVGMAYLLGSEEVEMALRRVRR